MTDYTATPEQWAAAEHYGDPGRNPRPMSEYACILELRARIEALEAVLTKPPSLAEQAPVPVSEQLPGPEDCDAEHYCWRWNTIGGLWARQPLARRWYEFESHWLPAHAIPLPTAND